MATATAGELQATRSHWISLEWTDEGAQGIGKEEIWLTMRAVWLGTELDAELEASRYTAKSDEGPRLTEWRVWVRGARRADDGDRVNVSDTMRERLNAACVPIVREWLESDEYPPARRRAVTNALRRKIRDESTSAERPRQLVEKLADEVEPAELENLRAACDALAELIERTRPAD